MILAYRDNKDLLVSSKGEFFQRIRKFGVSSSDESVTGGRFVRKRDLLRVRVALNGPVGITGAIVSYDSG